MNPTIERDAPRHSTLRQRGVAMHAKNSADTLMQRVLELEAGTHRIESSNTRV